MKNEKRDYKHGSARDTKRPGRPDSTYVAMHSATCSMCGKGCEVPFKPNGKKPVYCRNCFSNAGSDFSGKTAPSKMHTVECDTCGNECEVPFKPSGLKPIYCRDCFGKEADEPRGKSTRAPAVTTGPMTTQDQFATLNAKLDKILKLLSQ